MDTYFLITLGAILVVYTIAAVRYELRMKAQANRVNATFDGQHDDELEAQSIDQDKLFIGSTKRVCPVTQSNM